MDNNVKIRLKLRYAARLIAGIIFAFLFIQYIFDISHAQKIPRPITFTPHPNARDYYLSAYDQLSNIYGINQLKLTKNDYIKTGASIQQHTDGFNLLKQGLSCQFAETPRSSLIIYDSNTTNQFKYRKLAQILALKSEIEERNKQYKISAESASQAIELGVSISNNTDYYNYTYGIRCQNEGRKRLVRLIHLMDLHTCRDEITILQKVQQSQPTLCDVLENEKQWQLYRIYKSVPDYYGGVYSYFNREEITWYYGSITVPGGKDISILRYY